MEKTLHLYFHSPLTDLEPFPLSMKKMALVVPVTLTPREIADIFTYYRGPRDLKMPLTCITTLKLQHIVDPGPNLIVARIKKHMILP